MNASFAVVWLPLLLTHCKIVDNISQTDMQDEKMASIAGVPGVRKQLRVGDATFDYFSLAEADKAGIAPVSRLPLSLRVLLENVLRHCTEEELAGDAGAFARWAERQTSSEEIGFHPARVLMPDSSGVPLVVDLAAMRDATKRAGGDAKSVNPLIPVDIVIDHSVAVDHAGTPEAFKKNLDLEYARNAERYSLLKWAQHSFSNFRVVPPAMGIVHQVNVEHLARVVWTSEGHKTSVVYPDTLVGMDSHTTMVNGLGIIGWGVGGIEAGAAMLGQPISMLIPEVIEIGRAHV